MCKIQVDATGRFGAQRAARLVPQLVPRHAFARILSARTTGQSSQVNA